MRIFKKIFIACSILIIGFIVLDKLVMSNSQDLVENEFTTVSINSKVINLGTVKSKEESVAEFIIVNTGEFDLFIENVTSDCHCTVPTWDHSPIRPNDSTVIIAEYDMSGLGFFQQNINVEINALNSPLLFIMRGKVVEENLN